MKNFIDNNSAAHTWHLAMKCGCVLELSPPIQYYWPIYSLVLVNIYHKISYYLTQRTIYLRKYSLEIYKDCAQG